MERRRRLQRKKDRQPNKKSMRLLIQCFISLLIYFSLLGIYRVLPETYHFVKGNLVYNSDIPGIGQRLIESVEAAKMSIIGLGGGGEEL